MTHAELIKLYNSARTHHIFRRDAALATCRRAITRPGWCDASKTIERTREWFDDWEKQLWDTYDRETRSLAVDGYEPEQRLTVAVTCRSRSSL